jgi:hypothetical protein
MAIIAYPGTVEQLQAVIDGPDQFCDECGRDLYAGIDEWTPCATDDGAGGTETLIVCERCHDRQYAEFERMWQTDD